MTVIDEFYNGIYDEMEKKALTIVDGGASSFEDYQYRVGFRKGLKQALQIMEDVIENVRKNDEKF